MTFQLTVINPSTDKRWDEFVLDNPLGSIYHHSAWLEVLQATYGCPLFCIGLEDLKTQQLGGIIPFLFLDSRLTGKKLVSLPLTSYCQPLFPDTEFDSVISFARAHHPHVDSVEVRCFEDVQFISSAKEKHSNHVTHRINLKLSLEDLFNSFHKTSVRQRIIRAEKNDVTVRFSEQPNDLKYFYDLTIGIRKKHGLPPQPYSFFMNMWRKLKPKNLLYVPMIEHKGKIVAAALVLIFKEIAYLEYSATDHNCFKLGANQKLIWETIKLAHNSGAAKFDFGRSSLMNQSLIEFKERWGAERYNLVYYYSPRANGFKKESGVLRRILTISNRHLPEVLLKLQGKIIYRHYG